MSTRTPNTGLLSSEDIVRFTRRSNTKGLARLAAHLAALALTGALLALTQGSGWMVAALWLHGSSSHFGLIG